MYSFIFLNALKKERKNEKKQKKKFTCFDMCFDAMATEGRKQREVRTNCWRRKRSVYTGVVKATFRKCLGKSPRKTRRRCHTLAPGKQQKLAHGLPSGAMAPRNTTQYLMELVYSELNASEPSYFSSFSKRSNYSPSRHEHTYSYEDTMDFQHRDFESVFFQNEI